ncbi:uncharacterized protein LOC111046349 [Nilaparvata lugens]|uniref:uncharacterized protein LOC111046349 n=1 Tax=Nilaparvata lugens TaxID=108931 RepID=UPI00193EBD04|nr:uncharacterized protein LOC111046349 [Nilaparvata lugens]XP_039296662.1 uncharacterized protein LOC111046349 [Nilaparvata lugens]
MRSTTVLHFLGWILLIWSRCSFEVLAKYQSKQTGSRGDRLLIGSLYPVRSFHDVMPTIAFFGIRCTPGGNQDYFKLGIHKIPDEYYEDDYGMGISKIAETKKVKLSDYFLTVYRRAWLCKPEGRPDLTDEFVSINTVIISIKDIYNIRYEEGVDVFLQKFDVDRVKVVERLCVAKDVVNNTYSFPFKCLDDWRYEQETEEISHIPDLAVEILKNSPRPVDDELEEDVPVQENSTSISDNGPSIRIEPSPSTIDKPNKKYVCQNSFVNTELFLPKCYQKFDGHHALIPQEEFGKRFMIIDREVQICESGENDRIFRISHTVIGRTNISNIEYGNGIIELYAIKLPDGGRSIRYTEVRNFYAKTRKPVMDYNVQYTFASIERVKSSVEVATDGTFEPIDIEYKLPPGSIFRLLISPEGYNLRLGSRPVADIDADDVVCQRLFNHHQIEYGINIEIITDDQNGLRHTLVHNTELIHIDTWDQIVYSCASVTNQSVDFLRVMNFLVTNNAPIHYIETYDGVEFIRFNERNGNDLLQIIEVKYLLNGTAVRFVGTLYAQGDNILSSYQLGLTPYIIKKGEIYPLPNTDVPTREHISRDYQWNCEKYEHFKNEKDQEKTMRLEVNGDSNLAANQPQVIICRANETIVERFPSSKS